MRILLQPKLSTVALDLFPPKFMKEVLQSGIDDYADLLEFINGTLELKK
jgi:hypothetical protein